MNTRLRLLLRHITYNLRGGFLLRPLAIALTLGCAGALLSELEETVPGVSVWVPKILFPSHADPQVAQVILGAIATSIMTVVSIVFAILLMTLTLASMQFSPRIIVSFARDRVTQWTLGIFLGTFSYCMAALPAARSLPRPFAPVTTVLGAMLLALACVAWLLFFIHHITQAISASHIVDRIASETEAVIDEFMPQPHMDNHPRDANLIDPSSWTPAVLNESSGYIRFVDTKRLTFLAKKYRIQIHLLRRVGHFVPAGIPLLLVSKEDRLSTENSAEFRGAFDIGPTRTLQQDVEFGVLQIVDIALKAISPAVNDPTTAIGCVDQLSRILIRYISKEPPESLFFDPPGVVRVSVPWISFDRLLDSAFGQIHLYAKGDAAVSLRILRALGDIAVTTQDRSFRASLVEFGRRVVAGCAEKLGKEELKEMGNRLASLEKVLARPETLPLIPQGGTDKSTDGH
ncbi:MAG: DUF2254 domain-containing protein [Acidobacteriia bacterium]|nr:DUF2254 domain-containing protein [Terriglobia bacterium]